MKKVAVYCVVLVLVCVCCLGIFTACNKKETAAEYLLWQKISEEDGEWWNDSVTTTSATAEEFQNGVGGFIKGVCHPTENYTQIKEANIGWVRFDICNLPLDANGELSQGYLSFKERAKGYADRGIKVFAVTPYPEDYINAGLDPRNEENYTKIMQIARFYVEDLQGIVSAFQITNEMGIEHFTLPLTISEAATFIGIQMKAMYRYRGSVAIGYNLGGLDGYINLTNHIKSQGYLDYADYVGADIYLGCFEALMVTMDYGDSLLEMAYNQSGKPIVLTEFGYMGAGFYKTDAEKLAILQQYGALGNTLSEAEIYTKAHMRDIIFDEDFPAKFRKHLMEICEIDESTMTPAEMDAAYRKMGEKLYSGELINHVYKEINAEYMVTGYEHTEEGQGKFLADFIPRVRKLDYLVGTIVYCYSDSDSCYICGQTDCPVETGWGLVDGDGNPKDSYYAVQTAFAN